MREIAEHKVDEPVLGPEGHGWLCAVCGERPKALAFAASEDHPHHFGHGANIGWSTRGCVNVNVEVVPETPQAGLSPCEPAARSGVPFHHGGVFSRRFRQGGMWATARMDAERAENWLA